MTRSALDSQLPVRWTLVWAGWLCLLVLGRKNESFGIWSPVRFELGETKRSLQGQVQGVYVWARSFHPNKWNLGWAMPLSPSFRGVQRVIDTTCSLWGVRSRILKWDQPSFTSCCPCTYFVTSANYPTVFEVSFLQLQNGVKNTEFEGLLWRVNEVRNALCSSHTWLKVSTWFFWPQEKSNCSAGWNLPANSFINLYRGNWGAECQSQIFHQFSSFDNI